MLKSEEKIQIRKEEKGMVIKDGETENTGSR